MQFQKIIDRQYGIANRAAELVTLPKYTRYAVCNLRGGIGKTTLAFNIGYLTDNLLAVDTCPQCNLSFFFDKDYYGSRSLTVQDIILPYLIPGIGRATRASRHIGTTNNYFDGKNSYFIQSSDLLFLLPSQMITALNQAIGLPEQQRVQAVRSIVFSLRDEIVREMKENSLTRCLIDTSPFFSGATQLALYAAEALIVPVRTDQQSVNSLKLLIQTLTSPQGEFRRYLLNGDSLVSPKIQMVVLTHCGWSRQGGNQNVPDRQTTMYARRVYEILSQHRNLLSTDEPTNHLFLLDDFLGSGRISSAKSKPINLLTAGETNTIAQTRVSVNDSVEKCKNQLRYISDLLW